MENGTDGTAVMITMVFRTSEEHLVDLKENRKEFHGVFRENLKARAGIRAVGKLSLPLGTLYP